KWPKIATKLNAQINATLLNQSLKQTQHKHQDCNKTNKCNAAKPIALIKPSINTLLEIMAQDCNKTECPNKYNTAKPIARINALECNTARINCSKNASASNTSTVTLKFATSSLALTSIEYSSR